MENFNKKWTDNEEIQLLNELALNLSNDQIAKKHNRTVSSINEKITNIAYKMFINNISKHEIITQTKLLEEDIDSIIKKNNINIIKQLDNINEQLNNKNLESNDNIINNINNIKELFNLNLSNHYSENKQIKSTLNINKIDTNIILNEKQLYVLEQFKQKKNIFITGAGGTGKSTLIKEIIKICLNNNIKLGVTATTGCASILIGGKTLHSYLGIGFAEKSAKELYNYNKYYLSYVIKKIKELEVLIIDEISMLDIKLFEKISDYLSLIKGHQNPFGNLQIILSGDFCQLEPVNGDYCFLSQIWKDLNLTTIFLDKMVRQENDKKFQKILRKLRYGICNDKNLEILKQCNNLEIHNNIKPTILYSKNIDVDKINKIEYDKLLKLNKKNISYEIKLPELKKNHKKIINWIKSLDIPFNIELCIDSQIMITSNINQNLGIINGTRGIIIDLLCDKVIIKTINNETIVINYHKCIYSEDNDIYFSYMPIKLAYAISIHKSQGVTLDAVEINIGKDIFAAGQAYTALSRTRDLNSIIIKDIDKNSFIIKDSVLDFYKTIDPKLKNII